MYIYIGISIPIHVLTRNSTLYIGINMWYATDLNTPESGAASGEYIYLSIYLSIYIYTYVYINP